MLGNLWKKIVGFLYRVGANTDDSEDLKLQKTIMVGATLMGTSFGVIYTPFYYFQGNLFGALSTIAWAVIVLLNLFLFSKTRNFSRFRDVILFTILIIGLSQNAEQPITVRGGSIE